MKKIEDKSENYTNQLEEKIVELRLQLKAVSNTLKTVNIENDRLISMLIHNLKNPIGISYSFSDMILAGIENYDAEKIQKHVQIIKNSSQYTIELLNSFSEYNQLKNSSTDYNFQLKNYNKEIIKSGMFFVLSGIFTSLFIGFNNSIFHYNLYKDIYDPYFSPFFENEDYYLLLLTASRRAD